MRVGTKAYSGDGNDNRTITHGIASALRNIQLALISRDDAYALSMFRILQTIGDYAAPFSGMVAADTIQAFPANGFTQDVQVGQSTRVNSGTGTYQLLTLLVDGLMVATGTYLGTGSDILPTQAITGLGFKPDFVCTKNVSTSDGALATTFTMGGGQCIDFDGTATVTTGILSLDADGFTLGRHHGCNEQGEVYHWFAIKFVADNFGGFSYTGDGNDNRDVAHGFGSKPKAIWIMPIQTSTPCWRPDTLAGDLTLFFSVTAPSSNRIQSFDATNVNLGTGANVNTSGRAYHGIAFGDAPDPVGGGGLLLRGVGA